MKPTEHRPHCEHLAHYDATCTCGMADVATLEDIVAEIGNVFDHLPDEHPIIILAQDEIVIAHVGQTVGDIRSLAMVAERLRRILP